MRYLTGVLATDLSLTHFKSNVGLIPDMTSWKTAHSLSVQAFLEPAKPQDKKSLMRILKKPIHDELKTTLFDLDKYLHALTSMSLSAIFVR